MRCHCCRKKVGIMALECKSCNHNFCSRCIVLEIHDCDGMNDKVCSDLNKLSKKLQDAVYTKKEKMLEN